MMRHASVGVIGGLLMSLALMACSGGGGEGNAQGEATPAGTSRGAALAAAAPETGGVAMSRVSCPEISRQLVDSGRSLYAGSSCSACHGDDGTGTAIGPDLADTAWIDIDGSYAAIARLVREGVPQPKEFAVAMPALGVAQLDSLQLCAVAAYTYSFGH